MKKRAVSVAVFVCIVCISVFFDANAAIVCSKGTLESHDAAANGDIKLVFKSTCHADDQSTPKITLTTTVAWREADGSGTEFITASNGLTGQTSAKCTWNPWLVVANANVCRETTFSGTFFARQDDDQSRHRPPQIPFTRGFLDQAQREKIDADILLKRKVPRIETDPPTGITKSSAILRGLVHTFDFPTTVEVMLGKQTSTSSNPKDVSWETARKFITKEGDPGDLFLNVEVKLNPGTRYYFKIAVNNVAGKAESAALSFVTPGDPQ
jgi:hypothetical protein